jgi:hypothetical protein
LALLFQLVLKNAAAAKGASHFSDFSSIALSVMKSEKSWGFKTSDQGSLSLRPSEQQFLCVPFFRRPVTLAPWKSLNPSNALIADNVSI